jgi:hypothetical protein
LLKKLEIISWEEDMEKLELSHTIGKNVKYCGYCEKQCGDSSKKKPRLELPYILTILPLDINIQKN